MAEKPKPRMVMLPVKLDKAAVMIRSKEMAEVSKQRTDKSIELQAYVEASKGAKKTLESELAALDAHLSLLGTVVRTESESREVEVLDEIDARKGVMNTIRLDTQEIVGTRGLTEAERQRSLFTEEKGTSKAKTGKQGEASA
jgi:hypothetical protein